MQEVLDLGPTLATLDVAAIEALPPVITLVGHESHGTSADLDVNRLIHSCLIHWYSYRLLNKFEGTKLRVVVS